MCSKKFLYIVSIVLTNIVNVTPLISSAQDRSGSETAANSTPVSVVSPSPEGSSLGKYGNVPLNLFKGVEQIDIPMYTIKLGNITVPISINYSSTGIKVNDVATNVGLGWTLLAGGAITCAINDKSDFRYTKTLPINASNFNPNSGSADADYNFAKNYLNGTGLYDLQPDDFYYNICGQSGRFFFDADNTIGYSVPKNDFKISRDTSGWRLIDNKGTIYFFRQGELSSISDNVVTGNPRSGDHPPAITTIYISRIQDVKGNIVNFEYTNTNYKYFCGREEIQYQYVPISGAGAGNCRPINSVVNYKTEEITGSRIKRISSPNNGVEVIFNYSALDREDLETMNSSADSVNMLDQVVIRSNGKIIKSYALEHSYFRTSDYSATASVDVKALNSRLQLNSITPTGLKPYLFSYEQNVNLPSRSSFAVDYYGYYNGANSNTTGIPTNSTYSFSGANRDPNPNFAQANILKRVTYPTGGYTALDYQQNIDSRFQNTTTSTNSNSFYSASANRRTASTLVINQSNTYGTITYNLNGGSRNQATASITGPNGFDLELTGNGTISNQTMPQGNYTISMDNSGGTQTITLNIALQVLGTSYQLVRTNVGGVRVWQTMDQPNSGMPLVKKYYRYNIDGSDTSQTSGFVGKVLNPMSYLKKYTNVFYTNSNGNPIRSDCHYNVFYSNPVPLLGKDALDNYGYRTVTVLTDSLGTQGKTVNTFTTSYDDFYDPDHHNVRNNQSFVFGSLLQQDDLIYNNANHQYSKLKSVRNQYQLKLNTDYINDNSNPSLPPNQHSVYGLQIVQTSPEYLIPTTFAVILATYDVETFPYLSAWFYLNQTDEMLYNTSDSTKFVKTSTNFYYDNPVHLQLTRTVTNKSDGKTVTSFTTYPDDYASGTGFIDEMKSGHESAMPIEQASYQDDASGTKFLRGQIYQYKAGGKGLVDKVYKIETNSPIPLTNFKLSNAGTAGQFPNYNNLGNYIPDSHYQEKLNYNLYDNLGNVLMLTPTSGPSTSYLWGYNSQYPIVKIENASYQDMVSVLGQSVVDQLANNTPLDPAQVQALLLPLRTDNRLKNALITTYTYNPLVGMTSTTDNKGMTTTYEYDSFQRLMNVKDKGGNIIKHNDYHYQNQ